MVYESKNFACMATGGEGKQRPKPGDQPEPDARAPAKKKK